MADLHTCPRHDGTHVFEGSRLVSIAGSPVACVEHNCLCDGVSIDPIATGAATVMLGGKPVARKGELTGHGGVLTTGASNVLIGGPSTPATLASPMGPLEVVPEGQPLTGNQVTRDEYLRLWEESKLPDRGWGGRDLARWKAPPELGGDRRHLLDYKDQWIRDHATSIKVAARMNGLPPLLLAGTAWSELGGDPTWADDLAHQVRTGKRWADENIVEPVEDAVRVIDDHDSGMSELIGKGFSGLGSFLDDHDAGMSELAAEKARPLTDAAGKVADHVARPPELTSGGDVSIQIRRAAEVLDLDPSNLSYGDRRRILAILKNDRANLRIVARHLKDLSEVDFAGHSTLGDEEIRIVASRYNRGPDLSLSAIKRDTSYGDSILRRKDHLLALLEDATASTSMGDGPQPVARGIVPV